MSFVSPSMTGEEIEASTSLLSTEKLRVSTVLPLCPLSWPVPVGKNDDRTRHSLTQSLIAYVIAYAIAPPLHSTSHSLIHFHSFSDPSINSFIFISPHFSTIYLLIYSLTGFSIY